MFFLITVGLFFILTPLLALAAEPGLVPCSFAECSVCHLLSLAGNIFNWLTGIAFLAAVLLVLWSGYQYLWAAGDQDKIDRAKLVLKYTVLGFAACLFSWLMIHLVYTVSGYKGNWWRMECGYEASSSVNQPISDSELYKNEVNVNNPGGRHNPLALTDLAATGLKNLPANKYFFLHGLGGQQLAKITQEASQSGKIVYVITPSQDPNTLEINGSQVVSLTSQLGPTIRQTENNILKLITGLVADSPTGTNFPFFIADSADALAQFNNVWPENVAASQSLKTVHNGVVYQEGEELQEGTEQTLFTVNLVSDRARNPKYEKFSLDRDNPITFNLPENISPAAARQMAVDITQSVAAATKNSQVMGKDEWQQLVNLMSKEEAAKTGQNNSDNENQPVYNPAVFASYAMINPGQTTDAVKLAGAEKDLNKLAKDIIDREMAPAEKKGLDQSIQEYFLSALSATPYLDQWIAQENKTSGKTIDNYSDVVNVNRVPTIDPSRLSKIGGHISTDNILSLQDREALKELVVDVQKEIKDNTGMDYQIPTDLVMCVFNKETKFDPGAMSQTGCSGLGQLNMGAARTSIRKLKTMAPRYFMAFTEKTQQNFGVDLEETLTREGGNDLKRIILRSDPNLNAVLAFVHLTNKGVASHGQPAEGLGDLRYIVKGYGPGNLAYANSVLECYKNQGWKDIPANIQAKINERASVKIN
jgi:hypothetical protein